MRLSQYLPEAIPGPAVVLYSLVPGNLGRPARRRLAAAVHQALPADARLVVDVGCGPGGRAWILDGRSDFAPDDLKGFTGLRRARAGCARPDDPCGRSSASTAFRERTGRRTFRAWWSGRASRPVESNRWACIGGWSW